MKGFYYFFKKQNWPEPEQLMMARTAKLLLMGLRSPEQDGGVETEGGDE